MTNEQWAYLAGIIDGEGYIGISRNNIDALHKSYLLKIVITTTSIPLVNWLVANFEFKFLLRKKSKDGFNRKQVYHCIVSCNTVVKVLKAVYPYLVIKKPKADLILNEWPESGVRDNLKRTELYNRIKQLTKEA